MAAARHGCRPSKNRDLGRSRLCPWNNRPRLAHQNEMQDQAHPAHAEIERPPDLPPAPAGRAKIMVGHRAADSIGGGLVTFLSRKSETERARERNRRSGDSDSCRCATQARNGRQRTGVARQSAGIHRVSYFRAHQRLFVALDKDIGSKVEKGELLASIDTPEVDQELSQARAAREQIKRRWGWRRSPLTGGRICGRATRFRNRRPISRRAAMCRPRRTWRRPMRTCGGWKSWSHSKMFTLRFPACLRDAMSIRER